MEDLTNDLSGSLLILKQVNKLSWYMYSRSIFLSIVCTFWETRWRSDRVQNVGAKGHGFTLGKHVRATNTPLSPTFI